MRDLYKFHGHYARLTLLVQRKVCLVIHGQNGSAARKHVGHPLAGSHFLRHVLDETIGKIAVCGIFPKTKVQRIRLNQDQKRRIGTCDKLTPRS